MNFLGLLSSSRYFFFVLRLLLLLCRFFFLLRHLFLMIFFCSSSSPSSTQSSSLSLCYHRLFSSTFLTFRFARLVFIEKLFNYKVLKQIGNHTVRRGMNFEVGCSCSRSIWPLPFFPPFFFCFFSFLCILHFVRET